MYNMLEIIIYFVNNPMVLFDVIIAAVGIVDGTALCVLCCQLFLDV